MNFKTFFLAIIISFISLVFTACEDKPVEVSTVKTCENSELNPHDSNFKFKLNATKTQVWVDGPNGSFTSTVKRISSREPDGIEVVVEKTYKKDEVGYYNRIDALRDTLLFRGDTVMIFNKFGTFKHF